MKALGVLMNVLLVALVLYAVPIPFGVFYLAGFVAYYWPKP